MQCLNCKHSKLIYGCARYLNGVQISTSSFKVYGCSFYICQIKIKTIIHKLFDAFR